MPALLKEKTVYGVARHLTQCPVVMQVALLHRLAAQNIDPYETSRQSVSVTLTEASELLTDYNAASHSDQVPRLLHKCYKCQEAVFDIQSWRRRMKRQRAMRLAED